MKSTALTKYLDQLERTEDDFAMRQSLDSSTWNIADARNVASFYSSQLAYAKLMIKRAAAAMDEAEEENRRSIDELRVVNQVLEEWKENLPEWGHPK